MIACTRSIPILSAYHFAASSELAGISTIIVFSGSNRPKSCSARTCQNLYLYAEAASHQSRVRGSAK